MYQPESVPAVVVHQLNAGNCVVLNKLNFRKILSL